MKTSFCYIVIGILLSSQGYSCTLNIPDSTFIVDYYPNDTAGIYCYESCLDEKPYFKGGKQVLIDWFHSHVNYPSELLVHDLKMNYFLFVVADTFGKISLEKTACGIPKHKITSEAYPILRDTIAHRLDDEILKSMETFPICEPGKHRSKKRVVHFVLIVMFNPSVNQQKASDPLAIPIIPLR